MSTYDPPRPWIRSYADGVPADLPAVTGSLLDIVASSARDYPDAPALQFFGRETTYRELMDAVEHAAAALQALGVGKGDTVAIVLPNCPQHIVAFYAILRLGAIAVEHNPLYTPRELRKQFEDHGAKTAIVWSKVVQTVQDFPADLAVPNLISVDVTKAMPVALRFALHLPIAKARRSRADLTTRTTDAIAWEKLLQAPALPASFPGPATDDVAIIQYTSGTTGTPKGAVLTHRNLLSNARQAQAWVPQIQRGKGCVVYAVLPMFHAFGMTLYLTFGVLKRARIVLFPTFDVDMVLDAAKKRPPTVYCAVPPIYEKTARRAIERKVSLKSARFCISGAMKLTDPVVELWESVSGGLLVEGYGLTETAPVALGNPFWPTRRTGTIGVPFPSTQMLVVDPEDPTREVAQGEEGELLLKGPQVFSGYWNAPEETAKALLPDGWLRTGDVVVVDADGFTTIVDRLKEIIVTGGFNVSPSEVEHVLVEHPDISDVAVVGLQTESGEQVAAAVVLREGAHLDVAAVRAWAKERLAAYKVPRSFVEVEELPKSMLGKVLRKQVREAITSAS